MQDYWATVVEGNKTYQMGPQSHRVYMLDLLGGLIKVNNEFLSIKSLLDVGCGTAPIYEMLLFDNQKYNRKWEQIEKYKGVDPSQAMIDVCRSHFPMGEFAIENATKLEEEDNSWDCLLYMHSFDYIFDYQKAIREMYRVSKKYVCIILWQPFEKGSDHRLNNSVNGGEAVDWDTARLQHFSWYRLDKELKDIGFKLLLIKDDEEINKEGRNNTLILLEKYL